MRKSNLGMAILLSSLALLSGCGNGTDPLGLTDRSSAIPSLSLPFRDTLTFVAYMDKAHAVRDGIEFYSAGGSYTSLPNSMTVYSPVSGVVVSVSTAQMFSGASTGTVDIRFNNVYTLRLTGVTTTYKVGDQVLAGSSIGYALGIIGGNPALSSGLSLTPNSGAGVRLTLLANGTAICPYSFFDTATQASLTSNFFGSWASKITINVFTCQ